VRLLLDTHASLWFLLDDTKLKVTARSLIGDPNNDIEVSPATYREIAIASIVPSPSSHKRWLGHTSE
jgi:PIN domain nuclease of toxin-antitoxin system